MPEAKSLKNRLHLDLAPTDRSREAEVERLLGLGATQVADHRRPDGRGWITLADPEGNELCVLTGELDRADRTRTSCAERGSRSARTAVDDLAFRLW